MKLLIANRGEIAIRIARAAAELGIPTVAVYSQDDANCLHTRKADDAVAIPGTGARAYLDIEAIVGAARSAGCTAVHPGYGFLSENANLARMCHEAGLVFVGPSPAILDLLGNKVTARVSAIAAGLPVLPGSSGATSLEETLAFFDQLPAGRGMVIKAVSGGGGRGMRIVTDRSEIEAAYQRCRSEALASFGDDRVYVELLVSRARHVEVQILGDSHGAVMHLWERECSLQRRNQKLVEIAPSPSLSNPLREAILSAATRFAHSMNYEGLGTFEFLVDLDTGEEESFYFMEANPRLQVEHTVTEEVTGIDLVQVQLRVSFGESLVDLGLDPASPPKPVGYAIQMRVNMETIAADGSPRPASGSISAFESPGGSGVRVETLGYTGYRTSSQFDSLLAKVIVHSRTSDFPVTVRRARRALSEFRIEGVATNIPFLSALLAHADVESNEVYTRFIEEHVGEVLGAIGAGERKFFETVVAPTESLLGARVDLRDPLAVLSHSKSPVASTIAASPVTPMVIGTSEFGEDATVVRAPMQGTVISIDSMPGERVRAGQQLLVMEAMKMEHVVVSPVDACVRDVIVSVTDTIPEGQVLFVLDAVESDGESVEATDEVDLDEVRPDLAELLARQAWTLDAARPDAVARRRKTHQRTARENVNDMCDRDSFVEYGSLVVAAQKNRSTHQELIEKTPADGLITGIGKVNSDQFDDETSRCVVMSYDYTVLAGTQGRRNHWKHDRMFHIAEKGKLPLIFFTEGGGGRPGDDKEYSEGLRNPTFFALAKLSGQVPMIAINSGRAFAGSAAVLGFCDVVIAARDSSIGMGGPAMIEGGGLGVFKPEEIGPIDVQSSNGVVDIVVADEAEGVAVAKKYLSYFQGRSRDWKCADQRLLRRIIPENRLRVYSMHQLIETLADADSVLELRKDFGLGMITAFARIEGRPVGILANNPSFLAGAIDRDGSDKAARFMRLCNAFGIPIVSLCDTPGIMVGPESEKTALVRHSSRVFVTAASLEVPLFTIVIRKSYGLGTMAMAGGGFRVPFFAISWPTGEFGGMGLEGSVKLGYRKELEAIDDIEERRSRYDELVASAYRRGKAIASAENFELDEVIDPIDTRRWILAGLESSPPATPWRQRQQARFIDTW